MQYKIRSFILILILINIVFSQTEDDTAADQSLTYKSLWNCQTTCKCETAGDQQCGLDAIKFEECILNATDQNCLSWNEHILEIDDGNRDDGVDYDYIDSYRLCYEVCKNQLSSNSGKDYGQCMLDCSSMNLNIISLTVLLVIYLCILI